MLTAIRVVVFSPVFARIHWRPVRDPGGRQSRFAHVDAFPGRVNVLKCGIPERRCLRFVFPVKQTIPFFTSSKFLPTLLDAVASGRVAGNIPVNPKNRSFFYAKLFPYNLLGVVLGGK